MWTRACFTNEMLELAKKSPRTDENEKIYLGRYLYIHERHIRFLDSGETKLSNDFSKDPLIVRIGT